MYNKDQFSVLSHCHLPFLLINLFLGCVGFPLDDGGSEITSYAVERRSKGAAGNWAIVGTVADPRTFLREDPSSPTSASPPPSPLTSVAYSVSQLSPGEAYQFRVIANNKRGVRFTKSCCLSREGRGSSSITCNISWGIS